MNQRTFDDTQTGEEIDALRKGPLTSAHLVRWSAAIENWHKIHYDEMFTREHESLPGLLVNGTLKQQFIIEALTHWAGPRGWVWKVSFQFRSMNLVDEELFVWARVTGKRAAERFGLVDLELGIRNQEGKESTPGNAVIALPFRDGTAVPYPFVPPEEHSEREVS
jgi:hydroxyacyl-ACP dehydratase HTD2-like protein with hotdog domain